MNGGKHQAKNNLGDEESLMWIGFWTKMAFLV